MQYITEVNEAEQVLAITRAAIESVLKAAAAHRKITHHRHIEQEFAIALHHLRVQETQDATRLFAIKVKHNDL